MATALISADNKRRHPRHKTLKSGKVVFNDNQSVYDCVIRDISEGGAKLVFPDLVPLPKHFTLRLHDGTEHVCDIVRTEGATVGVVFVGK